MSRPKLLYLSECTPDPNGTGWEQRAFSFLKAYSKRLDVELWFQPSAPEPGLSRLNRIEEYFQEAFACYPGMLNSSSSLAQRLEHSLDEASCVHVFKHSELLDSIDHPHIYWDLDELPWFARNPDRNSHQGITGRTVSIEEKQRFKRCLAKAEKVFVSSEVENEGDIPQLRVIPNVVQMPT